MKNFTDSRVISEKFINLGDYYRHYIYSPFCLITKQPKRLRSSLISEKYDENKEYYANCAKRKLRDIVISNLPYGKPRFITLTYASPEFSSSKSKRDFKTFIQRLRYHLGELGHDSQFRYIAVPEEHNSDSTATDRIHSYHFHVILFDLPYIDTTFYARTWSHGFIKINLIKGSAFSTAFYLTKYLSKTTLHKRCERRYLVSRNIYRPREVYPVNLPALKYNKGSNYKTFSGSSVRVDYYQLYTPSKTNNPY